MSRVSAITPFVYVATKSGGGTSLGFRQAKSRSALAEQLRREKLVLARSIALPKALGNGGKIRPADNLVLNEQLSQLLSRGVPLVEALEVVKETVTTPAKPTVERLRDMVAAGSSFSDACRDLGVFDTVTVAVYKASERSGDLAGAAKQIAITMRRTMTVAGRAITLMIYPVIVMTISTLVALGMLTVVVPKLGPALKAMSVDPKTKQSTLPWFSELVIALGTFMSENILVLGLLLVVAVTTLIYFRKAIGRATLRFARRAPLMRDVLTTQEAVRFFSVMAAMSRSGVPLADAMGTANQTINDPSMRKQMERLRIKLIEGGQWRTLVDEVAALPVATRKLLIAAERSGDLEAAFNSLALDMTEELDRKSGRFLAVLQPLMVVFMFAMIGALLMAVMIPLITMDPGQ